MAATVRGTVRGLWDWGRSVGCTPGAGATELSLVFGRREGSTVRDGTAGGGCGGLTERVTVEHALVDEMARGERRGGFDGAVARSFGPVPELAECALPLLKVSVDRLLSPFLRQLHNTGSGCRWRPGWAVRYRGIGRHRTAAISRSGGQDRFRQGFHAVDLLEIALHSDRTSQGCMFHVKREGCLTSSRWYGTVPGSLCEHREPRSWV